MTSPEKKKAPRPGGAIKDRDTNHYQEEGITMTTIFAQKPVDSQANDFATIHVGGATIEADTATEAVVLSFAGGGERVLTPEVALSLATALQAVAVHTLEQRIEVAA